MSNWPTEECPRHDPLPQLRWPDEEAAGGRGQERCQGNLLLLQEAAAGSLPSRTSSMTETTEAEVVQAMAVRLPPAASMG